MTDTENQAMAVTVGQIKTSVDYIKESTERRLTNTEQFQLSVQSTLNDHESRIGKIETSMKTSFTWLGVILTVVTILTNVIMKLLP